MTSADATAPSWSAILLWEEAARAHAGVGGCSDAPWLELGSLLAAAAPVPPTPSPCTNVKWRR